ncbi:MAG TPA: molecular chaperone DnaJ [Clostridiales bacterium]|nr:molecular chaperone DnaJ [Clostridiales bacterium]
MKLNYFASCETLEELKREYKKLLFIHHPDNKNGDEEITKAINGEYDFLFPRLKNTFKNAKGEQYTKQNDESINLYKDIINSIIHLHNINIELIGSWLWVTGSTKEHKELFKQLKFKWSPKKSAWYHNGNVPYRKKSRKNYDMNGLRNLFGSEEVKTSPSPLIN